MVLVRAQQDLPYWKKAPGMGRFIAWHPPRYETIYAILTNSTYAGVFSYGKRKRHYDPSSKKYYFKSFKGEEIDIMISDHHEGYITQEEHAENLRTIQNNRFTSQESQGASFFFIESTFPKMKVARAVKADRSLVSCTRHEAWPQGFCDNLNGDTLWMIPL